MNKSMIIAYLKIFGATLIISPILYLYISLNTPNPLIYLSIIYICLWVLGIVLFNYLEYGVCNVWVKKKIRDKNKITNILKKYS